MKLLNYVALSLIALLISACSSVNTEPSKEPSNLELTIVASGNVNPDEKKRPSPIQVKIFELKADSTFTEGDFFNLMGNDKAILSIDLLVKDEFILRPGEIRTIKRKVNPNTTSIGILAGYYDMAGSIWREVIKLQPAPEAAWWRAVIPANKVKNKIELQSQGIVVIKQD